MKTLPIALILLLMSSMQHLHALDAALQAITYATPEKPYLEVVLEVYGTTLHQQQIDSVFFQSAVDVVILIRPEGSEDIVRYDKYTLQGPPDTVHRSLLDVRRFSLNTGRYDLELILQDAFQADNKKTMRRSIEVPPIQDIYLTEPQLLRQFRQEDGNTAFHKNGLYLEPLPSLFYDRGSEKLILYAEIYNANTRITAPTFLMRYIIEEELSGGQRRIWGSGNQRRQPKAIDAFLAQTDIRQMGSGNYLITLEVRDNDNKLLAERKLTFQRSNPLYQIPEEQITADMVNREFVQRLSTQELEFALRAISPLVIKGSEPEMLQSILQAKEPEGMRFFLFRHFVRQDGNNPEEAYKRFMEVAKAVDTKFHSGFRYGFETDRGRTFIRYGKPDDLIRVDDEPSAPPYEIWVYYNFPATNQRNVKFLFYNPTLAGEDFLVLHSTARGEINNPRWERELYQRNAGEQYDGDNYQDATRMQRNVNRNARIYFEDF